MVNAVRRTRATAAQAGLSNARRRENVAGAFRVKKPHTIAGRRVLLIDDVMTTGRDCQCVRSRAKARRRGVSDAAGAGARGSPAV